MSWSPYVGRKRRNNRSWWSSLCRHRWNKTRSLDEIIMVVQRHRQGNCRNYLFLLLEIGLSLSLHYWLFNEFHQNVWLHIRLLIFSGSLIYRSHNTTSGGCSIVIGYKNTTSGRSSNMVIIRTPEIMWSGTLLIDEPHC